MNNSGPALGAPMECRGKNDLFDVIYKAMPLSIFRVTEDVEILRCINVVGTAQGCGREIPCSECLNRNSVINVYNSGKKISRKRTRVQVVDLAGNVKELGLLLTVTPTTFEN